MRPLRRVAAFASPVEGNVVEGGRRKIAVKVVADDTVDVSIVGAKGDF